MSRSSLVPLTLCALFACGDSSTPTRETEPDPVGEEDAGTPPSPAMDAATFDAAREGATDARVAILDTSVPVVDASVETCVVGPVPMELRQRFKLDEFYKQYADADGLPVLGSNKPGKASLNSACMLVKAMVSKRDDVRKELIKAQVRFVIIGKDEGTAEVPEYGYYERPQADRDAINKRARGLGGQVASCGEENIVCLKGDRYFNESICLHEFAHTISSYGVYRVDRTFQMRLKKSYDSALQSGILDQTYRAENEQEYWAEGVQDYYDTNASANPPNGIHNTVDTRPELASYDPTLYALIEEVFPETLHWMDCHAH